MKKSNTITEKDKKEIKDIIDKAKNDLVLITKDASVIIGNDESLTTLLAIFIKSLNENTKIDKRLIEKSIELGFKTDKEIKEDFKNIVEKILERF